MSHKKAMDLAAELQAREIVLVGERVAIMRDEGEEITKGGIIVPDNYKEKPIRGTIVAVGTGVTNYTKDERYDGIKDGIGKRVTFIRYHQAIQSLTRLDGTKVEVQFVHASDVYFMWPAAEGEE